MHTVTEIFIDLQIEFIESSAKRGALYAVMTFFVWLITDVAVIEHCVL